MRSVSDIIKQPLFHFLLLGGFIFIAYSWIGDKEENYSQREIVITPGRIETLAATFENVWQRRPSESELDVLVDEFITEEIYYREALAIGLDQDDTIVRRRLRQKMEFITADLAVQFEPSDQELNEFLLENRENYKIDPVISFRQVYLNPDKRRDAIEGDAKEILSQLKSENPPIDLEEIGDYLPLDSTVTAKRSTEIDRTFGTGFSESLKQLELNSWDGPVRSGYGLHLVFVSQLVAGRQAELDEVRASVIRDWTANNTRKTSDRFIEQMKANYEITIQRH